MTEIPHFSLRAAKLDDAQIATLLVLCLSACMAHAKPSARTVCMAPMAKQAAQPSEPMMGQMPEFVAAAPLKIVIGKQSAPIDFEQGAQLPLPGKSRSLVEVWQHDQRKLSFWLRYSDYRSRALCLWYKPFYGTISVIERDDPRCRCGG
jgi:hypothetical protein